MRGSCSSSDNGCEACGIALGLYYVSASANRPKEDDGCPEFLSYTISKNKSSNATQTSEGNFVSSGTVTATTSYSSNTTITESEEGTTIITTVNGNSSANDAYKFLSSFTVNSKRSSNISGFILTSIDSCGVTTTIEKITAYWTFSQSGDIMPTDASGNGFIDSVGDIGCYDSSDNCNASCNQLETCNISSIRTRQSCSGTNMNSSNNASSTIMYSNPKDNGSTSAESIVSEQIGKLLSNTFPCSSEDCCSKCGGLQGTKDSCWGAAGNMSPADIADTVQRWDFKIAVDAEQFKKKYSSIGGTIIFYYGGAEGTSPCCNPDDFNGTIVSEKSYSLGGSEFKDVLLASDIGSFNNSSLQAHLGQNIGYCITIDSVTFI